jgi:hypothetical protein
MKLLIINGFGKGEIKESDFIPRVGEKVDMFYRPMPTVSQVVNWPSKEVLKQVNAENINIQAIVTVS